MEDIKPLNIIMLLKWGNGSLSQLLHLHDIGLHHGIDKEPVLLKLLWRHPLWHACGRFVVVQQVDEICIWKKQHVLNVSASLGVGGRGGGGLLWTGSYVNMSRCSGVCPRWHIWRAELWPGLWRSCSPVAQNLHSPERNAHTHTNTQTSACQFISECLTLHCRLVLTWREMM